MLFIGSRYVKRDITLVIEDVLERFAEGQRRQAGGAVPALQIHNLDFYYGANQVLFDVNLEIGQGEILALLGTNGAGKSTLLRAVSGLDHPHRGVIRIHGANCTYLEPEQIIDQEVALLVGGKMTFSGLTVRDNLRIGGYSLRHEGGEGPVGVRRGRRPVPRAGRPARPAGRHPVRGRAADAGPGPGDDDPAQAAAHRRAGPRAGPEGGGPADGHRPRGQPPGHDGGAGRAEREPGHEPGRAGHLHRARRGPLRRPHRRPLRARPTCSAPSSSAPPWPGSTRGAGVGPQLRPGPRGDHRPQLRAAGHGAGPHLQDQPGAQLRPGPAGRGGRRLHGQVLLRLRVQLLVRPGAVPGPGRRRRGPERAAAAAAVQPAPGPGHGGHHRAEPGAVRVHRPALHPARRTCSSRSRSRSTSPSASAPICSPRARS